MAVLRNPAPPPRRPRRAAAVVIVAVGAMASLALVRKRRGTRGEVVETRQQEASPAPAAAVSATLSRDGWRILVVAAAAALLWIGAVALREWAKAPPPPPAPAPVTPLRAAPARVDLPAGGQEPIGADEARWIQPDDYPAESIRAAETGAVRIRWRVEPDGAVSGCGVVQSSGHPRLDRAACSAIMKRGWYRPARDAAGWPVVVTRERRVRWQLPDDGDGGEH